MPIRLLVLLVFASGIVQPASADDWPQWLGPKRDSVWREDGIVSEFPADGLKVKWRAPVELGYSGPAVVDGRVYVHDYAQHTGEVSNSPGGRDALEGRERILCLSAESGKELWKHEYERQYKLSYPRGPRCTPTVDSGKVYTLGAEGDLVCLDALKGTVVWKMLLTDEYKVATPVWGFTGHPLVDGDLLYCLVGGEGSVAVAFDKNTGKEVWRALTASEPGYCPPTMIEHAGQKQLLVWHPEALNSLNPLTGEVYWSVELKPSYGMSVTAPRKLGRQLYASGHGKVAALLELDDEKPAAKVVWRATPKSAVYSTNSTPFLADGMIYGCDGDLGALMGARLSDGERLWQTYAPTAGGDRRVSHGTAFLVKHDDRFFLFSETGDLILAKLSREGYDEISRFHVLEPTNEAFGRNVVWSHPAFAARCLFARNDKEAVCVDLAAPR
ncbi:MAG: PQQ-binding-like beta-propeller repeat protein [Planctomycetaceae bacterium]